ncbi:MAG: hypothetical protein LIO44_07305, partial [Eubacterium sp.]|nr:hypothetical protein [Eubacterium sp.]
GTVTLLNFDNSTFISSRFKQPDVSEDICACGALFKKMISSATPLEGEGLSKAAGSIIKRTEAKSYMQFRSASEMKNAFKIYGGAKDKLSYVKSMIPGFRRGRLLNKIIALVVYADAAYHIYAGLYQIIEHDKPTDIPNGIFMIVYSLSMIIMPFFILSDFLYYRERLPFIRRLSRPLKTAVGVILTIFAYFFIGLKISYYSRIFLFYLFKIS